MSTDLTTVPLSTPGRLTQSAADSFERLKTAAKTTGTTQANHAWRSYEDQVALWNAYMTTNFAASDKNAANRRSWNGQTWWRKPGKPSVAIPGTSNHGDADTVDWQGLGGYGSPSWTRFAATAADHGWNNVEGRSVGEPWHWTYVASKDRHRFDTQKPATPQPLPPITEDEIVELKDSIRLIRCTNGAVVAKDMVSGAMRPVTQGAFNTLEALGFLPAMYFTNINGAPLNAMDVGPFQELTGLLGL